MSEVCPEYVYICIYMYIHIHLLCTYMSLFVHTSKVLMQDMYMDGSFTYIHAQITSTHTHIQASLACA